MTIFSDLRGDAGGDTPIGARQLEAFLRDRIASGVLPEGTRLPPVREAAWQLNCAPGTVSRAYQALTVSGLTHGVVGRGTFVGEGPRLLTMPFKPSDPARVIDMAVNCFLMEPAGDFLREGLEAAGARAAAGTTPLDYVGEMGAAGDREAALPYLARWRHDITPDTVCILNGVQSALSAAFGSLVRPGTGIACDQVTYPGMLSAAALNGVKLLPVTMDGQGMCPDALDACCRANAVSLVVLMPSVQNPTGRPMPVKRREAIAEVAARHALTIVEDEIYGFLSADSGSSFSALLPEQTLLVTGMSKCIAPAMRIGYAAGPGRLVRRVAGAHNAMQMMASALLSGIASQVIRNGALDRRIEAIRRGVRQRAEYVSKTLPGLAEPDLQGGLAWLTLPGGWRGMPFARRPRRWACG
ncbi:PLP-dependent aminotransferase family protein [Breoghania sp. L-A4]|uniref:aminotransferase-like domain-containing protein n=1 Tax=Breoghania sp. L-A4 TaxID=2304600 RepID=UPI000E359695|nr:PLP-dependent aminotransferase family protein [Breoghania sp. L-A4]AXS40254.1 PLP-dependent aminotransferase family protein [Breoghania sp. L-A4]